MQNLKGKLKEMDYNLSNMINVVSAPTSEPIQTQSTVCKTSAMASDND